MKKLKDVHVLKKVGQGLAWAYKPAVNVSAWMGLDIIKSSSQYLWGIGRNLFIPQKATLTESFSEAVMRLKLTEEDLQQRKREFQRLFITYAVIALGIVAYSGYLFYSMNFISGLMAILVSLLAFALAGRNHFWLFQLKHRKLGCTLHEWWYSTIDDKSTAEREGK
jgi:intracellular multiplication protein IcmV